MAKMFDFDASPQDAGFNTLRIGISIVAEYEPIVLDPETVLGWTIADLRSTIFDLVESLMRDEQDAIRECTQEVLDIAEDVFGLS